MSSYIDVSTWTITSCNAKHISLLLKLQSSLSIKKAITSQKAQTCHGECSTQTKRWISIDDPPTKAPRETGQRRNTLLMGQSLPDVSTSSSHLILCAHQPASQRWRTNSHILSSPHLSSLKSCEGPNLRPISLPTHYDCRARGPCPRWFLRLTSG